MSRYGACRCILVRGAACVVTCMSVAVRTYMDQIKAKKYVLDAICIYIYPCIYIYMGIYIYI